MTRVNSSVSACDPARSTLLVSDMVIVGLQSQVLLTSSVTDGIMVPDFGSEKNPDCARTKLSETEKHLGIAS